MNYPSSGKCRISLLLALVLICPFAASATTWTSGQVISFLQTDWGSTDGGTDASKILNDNYSQVYASTLGVFEVGYERKYTLDFTGAGTLINYFPATGAVAPLDISLVDPDSTASGAFGGDVAALKLNCDFSKAGLILGSSRIPFGDLILTNLTGPVAGLNGLTVGQFLTVANTTLGGGSYGYSASEVDYLALEIDGAFGNGGVSAFANTNLAAPALQPAQITSIVRTNLHDMLLTWNTTGTTNIVQACADAHGGISPNSFTNLATIVVTSNTTNFLDAGALTNSAARYYRILSLR